ncbi:anti-sigma factor RsbA family regulatory protein [Nocardia jejuensis]|uniref:anti-sigma factor RsbA family regulatory protein n=1 Tax=Nocardia jejuensis TaxID=328049 RepID=UPI00082C07B8|nr:anti-sigma factor RsbA family regulatory protein [Nocardia jejuensis]
MTVAVAGSTGHFAHPALLYRDESEYLDALVPFLEDGLATGEPVAMAAPESRLRVIRSALGSSADRAVLIDMEHAGRNPGRIIPAVLRRFADAHPDSAVRIVGEPIWAGRNELEYPACVQHEALINAAFDGRDVTIVCPYDVSGLGQHMIADAHRTHPVVWDGPRRGPSDRYDPGAVIARYNTPLPEPALAIESVVTAPAELIPIRQWSAAHGERLGLQPARLGDLELIVTELVTNGLVHGAGPCRVRLWDAGAYLVCEVRDHGRWTDPLAGRRPASRTRPGGRGLLMVHQLAELVRTYVTSDSTTQYALMAWNAGR